ncbi:hypothetical protein Nepgr_013457 [Nepenthes gracilis]|uniref:Uncharacterized protein n=1 Tax=Nepenthes gracilis TaxID=150966 RepID=A0AAD3SJ16_NEPGR|nr:hypothetical protein Nepgr_013457 [Nepenthes gracilis]
MHTTKKAPQHHHTAPAKTEASSSKQGQQQETRELRCQASKKPKHQQILITISSTKIQTATVQHNHKATAAKPQFSNRSCASRIQNAVQESWGSKLDPGIMELAINPLTTPQPIPNQGSRDKKTARSISSLRNTAPSTIILKTTDVECIQSSIYYYGIYPTNLYATKPALNHHHSTSPQDSQFVVEAESPKDCDKDDFLRDRVGGDQQLASGLETRDNLALSPLTIVGSHGYGGSTGDASISFAYVLKRGILSMEVDVSGACGAQQLPFTDSERLDVLCGSPCYGRNTRPDNPYQAVTDDLQDGDPSACRSLRRLKRNLEEIRKRFNAYRARPHGDFAFPESRPDSAPIFEDPSSNMGVTKIPSSLPIEGLSPSYDGGGPPSSLPKSKSLAAVYSLPDLVLRPVWCHADVACICRYASICCICWDSDLGHGSRWLPASHGSRWLRLSGQQDDQFGGCWRSMEVLLRFSGQPADRLGIKFWCAVRRLLTGLNAAQPIWLWIMGAASCSMKGC